MTELTIEEALFFIGGIIFVTIILPILMKIVLDREIKKETIHK